MGWDAAQEFVIDAGVERSPFFSRCISQLCGQDLLDLVVVANLLNRSLIPPAGHFKQVAHLHVSRSSSLRAVLSQNVITGSPVGPLKQTILRRRLTDHVLLPLRSVNIIYERLSLTLAGESAKRVRRNY